MNSAKRNLKRYYCLSIFQNDLTPHICDIRNVCGHTLLSFFSLDTSEENLSDFVPKREIDSPEVEWERLQKVRWKLARNPEPPDYIPLPVYICRHGGDSEQVRSKYIKAKKRLANLFYKHSFTKIIAKEAAKR